MSDENKINRWEWFAHGTDLLTLPFLYVAMVIAWPAAWLWSCFGMAIGVITGRSCKFYNQRVINLLTVPWFAFGRTPFKGISQLNNSDDARK